MYPCTKHSILTASTYWRCDKPFAVRQPQDKMRQVIFSSLVIHFVGVAHGEGHVLFDDRTQCFLVLVSTLWVPYFGRLNTLEHCAVCVCVWGGRV